MNAFLSFKSTLTSLFLGVLALLMVGCEGGLGAIDVFSAYNQAGVRPSYFVEGQQIVPKRGSKLAKLDGEILKHFDMVMVVNKGAKGEFAQTMTILRPAARGCGGCAWTSTNVWDVSTGREKQEERDFTTTPVGIYQLDSKRFHRNYQSTLWDGADMPFAMFWRYTVGGVQTGWAIHAAGTSKAKRALGKRDSGGCIRLHPSKAETLFNELLNQRRGPVPKFDWGSRDGEVRRSERGELVMATGIKALLVVDDGKHLDYVKAELPAFGFETQDEGAAEPS